MYEGPAHAGRRAMDQTKEAKAVGERAKAYFDQGFN
jgi:hypothetical protein